MEISKFYNYAIKIRALSPTDTSDFPAESDTTTTALYCCIQEVPTLMVAGTTPMYSPNTTHIMWSVDDTYLVEGNNVVIVQSKDNSSGLWSTVSGGTSFKILSKTVGVRGGSAHVRCSLNVVP